MRNIPMTFQNALNVALSVNSKLKNIDCSEAANLKFSGFLEPKEVLNELSESDKVDIRILINSVWEVDGYTF